MCSQAHFSSIVGFRVISIKDLSHLSLSLLRYCTEQEDLSLILFLSFFFSCARVPIGGIGSNTQSAIDNFTTPRDPCVVNNNIIRR